MIRNTLQDKSDEVLLRKVISILGNQVETHAEDQKAVIDYYQPEA